jgi:protein gp37
MGETSVEWTRRPRSDGSLMPGYSFNPWTGCSKLSPACDNCYAESWAKRAGRPELWQGERRRTTDAYWRQPLRWNRDAESAGERRMVFCASLADVFDNQSDPAWRADLWTLIAETPNLDWLLLSKRPQNIAKMLPAPTLFGDDRDHNPNYLWPWPNVWLGTTVESQAEADRRIPHLLSVPARIRFLSCEPLLGPVDLSRVTMRAGDGVSYGYWPLLRAVDPWQQGQNVAALSDRMNPGIDWVIAGGESGAKARPSHPDWFRSLRDQCAAAGVPFHFKQYGQFMPAPWKLERLPGETDAEYIARSDAEGATHSVSPSGFIYKPAHKAWSLERAIGCEPHAGLRLVGKKAAGRLLDGKLHHEFPAA